VSVLGRLTWSNVLVMLQCSPRHWHRRCNAVYSQATRVDYSIPSRSVSTSDDTDFEWLRLWLWLVSVLVPEVGTGLRRIATTDADVRIGAEQLEVSRNTL